MYVLMFNGAVNKLKYGKVFVSKIEFIGISNWLLSTITLSFITLYSISHRVFKES